MREVDLSKQDVLKQLCELLGCNQLALSRGSTVPAEIFHLAARAFAIDPDQSMPKIGEAVATAAGLEWSDDCDSTHTPSRGGSTVTRRGMNQLLAAVHVLLGRFSTDNEDPSLTSRLGRPYERARGGLSEPDKVVLRDLNALDSATRRHADIQNSLEAFLTARGITALSPIPPRDPRFDIAWRYSGGLVIAEVKTITLGNQRQQVRLGLGQLLDYAWYATRNEGNQVAAVLTTSDPLTDEEVAFCASAGVVATWPAVFPSSLGHLIDAADA